MKIRSSASSIDLTQPNPTQERSIQWQGSNDNGNRECVLVRRGCPRGDPDGDGALLQEVLLHHDLPGDGAVLDGVVREDALGPVDVVRLHSCTQGAARALGRGAQSPVYLCMWEVR